MGDWLCNGYRPLMISGMIIQVESSKSGKFGCLDIIFDIISRVVRVVFMYYLSLSYCNPLKMMLLSNCMTTDAFRLMSRPKPATLERNFWILSRVKLNNKNHARRVPTSFEEVYNPFKWPFKLVTGVI